MWGRYEPTEREAGWEWHERLTEFLPLFPCLNNLHHLFPVLFTLSINYLFSFYFSSFWCYCPALGSFRSLFTSLTSFAVRRTPFRRRNGPLRGANGGSEVRDEMWGGVWGRLAFSLGLFTLLMWCGRGVKSPRSEGDERPLPSRSSPYVIHAPFLSSPYPSETGARMSVASRALRVPFAHATRKEWREMT